MISIRRAVLFGFLMWIIPFVVAFAIFPLRESNRPLFESIMPVAVAAAAVALSLRCLRGVNTGRVRAGLVVGTLWLLMSAMIDAPLMLVGGPMRMTVTEYLADIGVTYVMIPVITTGIGAAMAASRAADARPVR